ncbi:hypothetical protein EGJ89_05080 [Stenotrophomonas maltophilia]|nr:hypothetical protein EGJ89_05080 [Stenotrophomonas maltophilia]
MHLLLVVPAAGRQSRKSSRAHGVAGQRLALPMLLPRIIVANALISGDTDEPAAPLPRQDARPRRARVHRPGLHRHR